MRATLQKPIFLQKHPRIRPRLKERSKQARKARKKARHHAKKSIAENKLPDRTIKMKVLTKRDKIGELLL